MSARSAASYLAEAAAWREQAEHLSSAFREDEGLVRSLWQYRGDPLVEAMMARAADHHHVSDVAEANAERCQHCGQPLDDDPPPFTRESRILAALFLALECEDDARKAKP